MILMRSYVGNVGLVPLDDPLQDERDEMNKNLDKIVKEAEAS